MNQTLISICMLVTVAAVIFLPLIDMYITEYFKKKFKEDKDWYMANIAHRLISPYKKAFEIISREHHLIYFQIEREYQKYLYDFSVTYNDGKTYGPFSKDTPKSFSSFLPEHRLYSRYIKLGDTLESLNRKINAHIDHRCDHRWYD